MFAKSHLAILTYHSLDDSGSVLSTAPRLFAEQMRILHEQGVRVVPLEKALLGSGSATEPCVAITFDDGFRNVGEYGLPVLLRYGFPATVFLVTDYCGKTSGWPSQPSGVTTRALCSWSEVRQWHLAGIRFGSHTCTHPDLTALPQPAVAQELATSKKAIEDAVGQSVELFAYPYGTYNSWLKQLVAAEFSLACSVRLGFVGPGSDPLALNRLDMYYMHSIQLFRRLFSPPMRIYLSGRQMARAMCRLGTRQLAGLGCRHV